jgi:hypothetical protein
MCIEPRINITLDTLDQPHEEGQYRERESQRPKPGLRATFSPVAVEPFHIKTDNEIKVGKREYETAKLVATTLNRINIASQIERVHLPHPEISELAQRC